jgi:hypothetical protein
MIKLYTNRELSEKLGINLGKWKRWSREFLPPDPLGGMQSGFARQYYFSDAFNVMLGGHLVGDLHFSVYEARKVIEILKGWLLEKGFYQDPGKMHERQSSEPQIIRYMIYIRHIFWPEKKQTAFSFKIRGIIFDKLIQHNGIEAREERYVETVIGLEDKVSGEEGIGYEKILDISALYTFFIGKLESQKKR